MVEDVEGLGAKLQADALGDGEGLVDGGRVGNFFGAAENARLRVAEGAPAGDGEG